MCEKMIIVRKKEKKKYIYIRDVYKVHIDTKKHV